MFVHVLDWPDPTLALPLAGARSATLVGTGEAVPFAESAGGLALTLPPARAGDPARVIALGLAPS